MEEGHIFIKKENDDKFKELEEPYIKNINYSSQQIKQLAKDEYFVLGDNRPNSFDSEEFGPIKKDDLIGEPLFRFLPITQINYLPANHHFNF